MSSYSRYQILKTVCLSLGKLLTFRIILNRQITVVFVYINGRVLSVNIVK